jgi:hypothetical protein
MTGGGKLGSAGKLAPFHPIMWRLSRNKVGDIVYIRAINIMTRCYDDWVLPGGGFEYGWIGQTGPRTLGNDLRREFCPFL